MTVLTPDGRSLTVQGHPLPFIGGWAYLLWSFGPDGGNRFSVTPAGSAEIIARQMGTWNSYVVREATWNNGRLLSLEDPENASTTMIWVGPHNEISGSVQGTAVPFEIFMDQLARFDIQDTPQGLTMIPRAGSQITTGRLLAVNTIDQVCQVQINPVADVASMMPRAAGKQVRGGSLWRVDEHDEKGNLRARAALLVGGQAAARIVSNLPDDPRFVKVVESISCTLA